MSEERKVLEVMNGVAERLRIVLIRTFKTGKYVKEKKDEIIDQTMYEFLESVHKKGKNKSKNVRRKRNKKVENEGASSNMTSIDNEAREIKNLPDHKQQFDEVMVKELLENTYQLECSERMKIKDITILCYILLNSLLDIELPWSVREAVLKVKDIRNEAFHPNEKHDEKWFKDCMKNICYCMEVFSKEYSLGPFVPLFFLNWENLKEKVDENYDKNDQFIELHYQYRTSNDIHSLEKFITEHMTSSAHRSCITALSGIPGSGKSTVVSQLAYRLSKTNVFKLVVLVNEKNPSEEKNEKKKRQPTNMFYSGLRKLAPDLYEENEDKLKNMLKIHMKDILVILDINAEYPKELTSLISDGNWVITTSTDFEAESWEADNLHVLKIKPLEESQVKELLANLNKDGKEYDNIMRKYENCTCKKALNTPELVVVFSSVKGDAPIMSEISLIQCLYDKKMESLKGKENSVISGLGNEACKAIARRTDYVSDKFICEEAIIRTFLVTEEKRMSTKVTRRKFSHTLLRDFLCAKYYVENPSLVYKMCRWAPYLYKRAFRVACYLAVSTDRFKIFKKDMKEFLSVLFNSSGRVSIPEERMKIRIFQNWGIVFQISEACQNKEAQKSIIELIAELIDEYDRWNLNCRDFREENVQVFCNIMRSMKADEEKVVTLVLYVDFLSFDLANRLWNALRKLEAHPFKLLVKFNIMHKEFRKECLDFKVQKSLKDFNQSINERCLSTNLSVVEYKGPMLLKTCPLGSDSPLRGLESLEVHVFDISSLKRLLSCKELESLRTLSITFEMSDSQKDLEKFCHSLPEENDKLRFSLNIVYHKGIQNFLNKINDIKCLTSLGILDITLKDLTGNDKVDLRGFKALKMVELRANVNDTNKDSPLDKRIGTRLEVHDKVVFRDRSTEDASYIEQDDPNEVVLMDIDTDDIAPLDQEDEGRKRRRDVCGATCSYSISHSEASPSQVNILANVLFPERHYCLILNGFSFSDLSFIHSLDKKRVIIAPGKLRVSDIPALLGESLESKVKRIKLQKDYEMIKKKRRFSREEREKLRKQPQPRDREIIIKQEESMDEDWSGFVKVDFHHVIRALQQYKGSAFSYKSDTVTLRKDVCGDIRVRLPVELLEDQLIFNYYEYPSGEEEDVEFLRDFYRTLSLVQFITLEETSLSRECVSIFVETLIETKKEMTEGGEVDPFHLSLVNVECIRKDDIQDSRLHTYVLNSKELDKFSLSCKKGCCHFRKTVDGEIWINRCKL